MAAQTQLPFRLVVVSSRGPYHLRQTENGIKYEKTVGGLTSAILPVLERSGGIWIAWSEPGGKYPNPSGRPPFDIRYLELTPDQVQGFYYGLSNGALWPVCHYFLGRAHYSHEDWQVYEQVNRQFADAVLEETNANDVVWVHDYQLARVPYHLRQERPSIRIGFFWHIPFPAVEMFKTLPWRRQLLESLLACDVLGLHIEEYVRNLKDAAVELLGATIEGEVVHFGGRETRVVALPIGIDYESVEKMARTPALERRVQKLRDLERGRKIILGVERMDYTKGILERLRGFEHLLKMRPELHDKVTLFQIVTPSREGVAAYREKKREIDEIVGRINGKFSNDLWTPLHYLYRSFPPSRLAVYYRVADVALVTPLRDGLNLVAKEYVASRVHQDGVLILSEFAGVTCQLPEALAVNPYDMEEMAYVIDQALQMPREEQRRRMQAMQTRIKAESISWWMNEFLRLMGEIKSHS